MPERRTRGSGKAAGAPGKKSVSKKGKAGAKKGRKGSGRVISASDWVDHDSSALLADGEFPSRSASEAEIDYDDDVSSDASEDEDFDIKPARDGRRGRGIVAPHGVRVNDEFHSMNNGLIGFPDSSRTQAGITFSPVRFRVPAWRLDVRISSEFIALCAQAYVQLRGFSWQLRLAPFSFEALVVALVTPQDSPLRDELHVCLLRSLAWHDSRAMRARRKLNLGHLDETTWKDYLWEYMRYVGALAWWRQHIIRRAPEQPLLDLRTGTPSVAPRPAAAAAANPAPGAPAWCSRMRALFAKDYYPQRLTMREYNELDAVDRAAMLTLLTDASLESPGIKDEVERRVTIGLMHAGQGGEGGACPMRQRADGGGGGGGVEGDVPPDEDVYDGCVLCTQVGDLVRCEGCRAPFHMACLGYASNPLGAWLCPECRMGGRGECAGARIPMAAMQPGRIPLYLLHGNVLRAPHPGQKYVEEDQDMVDVGLEFLQGDAAMAAMAVAKRKSGSDGCHPTAPEGLVVQCSSDALGEAGSVPEQITAPSCTPWDYRNSYRYSWPEACGVLERAVEESRKQKRRGTPNVSVFAGMSLPEPVVMPLHMPKRHVRFLHALHAEARRAASLPPPTDADTKARGQALLEGPAAADGDDHGGSNGIKVEGEKADNGVAKDAEDGVGKVKEEDKDGGEAKNGEAVPLVADALAHPALNPPEGALTLMDTLKQYLLQLEFHLWGVLDRGWTGGMPYRRRYLAAVLEAQTPLLLARLMLMLMAAVRPRVQDELLLRAWSFMDIDVVPGGLAILDPAARAEAARAEAAAAAAAQRGGNQGSAYIGRTTVRSAQAAAEAAEAAAAARAAGLDYSCRADTRTRDRDRERERRRRRGQDDNDEPLEPFLATPFADDEVDEAPATGVQPIEPGAEFGHLESSHAPVNQEEGYAGPDSKRDPNSLNRRKRTRAKRPTKASVAASGVASGDGSAGGPTGAAAVSAATGSALSQRRKYIMNLTEARSIGKRPSPMFTNFCYFKAQDARVLPLERLPAVQVRRAGKQGCGTPIVGMVYPRLTTSSEAVARLALEPLKWRGMLENCVSVAQVALAFRRLEECLTLAPLDPAWLQEPENAILQHTRITARREAKEPGPDPESPQQRVWEYLCHVASPPNGVHYGAGMGGDPSTPSDPAAPAAKSMAALQPGRTVWLNERALPLAFIKVQEEAARTGSEYVDALAGEEDEGAWLLGPPGSGGVRSRARPRDPRHVAVLGAQAAAQAAAAAADAAAADAAAADSAAAAAAESMASRRSRRNVGRKVYYDDEGEVVHGEGEGAAGGSERGRGYGYGQPDDAAEPPVWDGTPSRRPARAAGAVQVGLMDASDAGRSRRKPGPKRKSGVLQPWVPAALGALEQVAQLDIAEAFREPVPRGVPYYHDIVKKPMDLGTIALQLERGMYQTLPELQADMQLVWDNCAAFNEPESDIAGAGRHLADLWRRVGSSDALMAAANAAAPAAEAVQPRPPMPAQQPGGHGPPAGIAGAPLQPGWGGMSTMSRATVPAAVDAALMRGPPGAGFSMAAPQMPQQQQQQAPPQHPAAAPAAPQQAQLATLVRIISQLQRYEYAQYFLEPVPREVQGYYEVIRRPMDLGTVVAGAHRGVYPTAGHCHNDVMLVWQNCYQFNMEGSEIYRAAQHCEAMYRRMCAEARLM